MIGDDAPELLWCNAKTRNLGMNLVLPQIKFIEVPRLMRVSYTATLPVRDQTVLYLSSLLHAERVRRGTRKSRRSLTPFKQAVLVLRWFLDSTRVRQLAVDNEIGKSTTYTYLDEGFTVLAAQAPALESASSDMKAPYRFPWSEWLVSGRGRPTRGCGMPRRGLSATSSRGDPLPEANRIPPCDQMVSITTCLRSRTKVILDAPT